jgi:hypothetical protein
MNAIALIAMKKTGGATGEYLPGTTDYILWYGRNQQHEKFRQIHRERKLGGAGGEAYTGVETPTGLRRRLIAEEVESGVVGDKNRVFRLQIVTSQRPDRPSGPRQCDALSRELQRKELLSSRNSRLEHYGGRNGAAPRVDLLRMDGVRFPDNKQRKFTRREPIYAEGRSGEIHAEGRWVNEGETDDDPNGAATVGVVFGPQYGPISAKMVEEVIRNRLQADRYDGGGRLTGLRRLSRHPLQRSLRAW